MKKKSKNARPKKKKEFRFYAVETINNNGKMKKMYHPAYVFLQKGNLYIYVTITHSSNITGVMLIKLRKNPNPKDKTDSFRTKKISEDTKDRFGRRHDSWVMDETDDKEIRKDYEASIKKR